MQKELADEEPSLKINIIGINEINQEFANDVVTAGRDLPWLQDVDADGNERSDVWSDLWKIEYRDVVVLDAEGHQFGVYNLTRNDLAVAENYSALKHMMVDAAAIDLFPWQNKSDPSDVSNDGNISPIDALLIINYLISEGSKELPPTKTMDAFLDSTGDNFVSPLDAVTVINRLIAQSAEAENENDNEGDEIPAVARRASSYSLLADAAFAMPLDSDDDFSLLNKKSDGTR
jgi:hypothetical protein